jgi:ankyrin repeat protein
MPLLNGGAIVNRGDDYGSKALHKAAARGHTNVINVLLKGNADTELGGSFHKTAIILAGEIG